MAKCHHRSNNTHTATAINNNSIGSLILKHSSSTAAGNGHFRLWTAFSTASFRRRIFDAVSCGASSRFRHSVHDDLLEDYSTSSSSATATAAAAESKQSPNVSNCSINANANNNKNAGDKKAATTTATATATAALRNGKSEKLSDLLSIAEVEAEAETKKKVEALEELKRVVRDLQLEEEDDDVKRRRSKAASRVRFLAKEDSAARINLAMLGAIPPLVGMLDLPQQQQQQQHGDYDSDPEPLVASLYALLNLGIGNDANKAAIVKAGAVHKMLKIIESPTAPDHSVSEAIVANFLGLSALDSNKLIIGSSGAIPFLVNALRDLDGTSSAQPKQDALRALYNLSICPANISFILETDLIRFLISSLGDMEVSERILTILSNLVSTPEGRKAISIVRDAFPILVDVLNWTDSPGCQEKVSYILMVMAHKSYGDRQSMIEAGIGSALLELTLLGSTLAQKRASRILECLRVDKGKQVLENYGGNLSAAVSAPLCGPSSSSSSSPNGVTKECLEETEDMMSEEKKAVKQLVQQSLQNNMRRIVKRANLPQDFVPSEHFKTLTLSSTSKSLPF